jgi:hypothetical protein
MRRAACHCARVFFSRCESQKTLTLVCAPPCALCRSHPLSGAREPWHSATKSTSDMDSYFDNLPGGLPNHRKAHSHHAKHGKNHVKQEDPVEIAAASPSKHSSNAHLAHSKEAQKVGDDGLPVLPTKRMHSHSHAAGRNGKQNRDAFATDPSRTPGQKALNLPAPKLDLQAIHDKIAQQIKVSNSTITVPLRARGEGVSLLTCIRVGRPRRVR